MSPPPHTYIDIYIKPKTFINIKYKLMLSHIYRFFKTQTIYKHHLNCKLMSPHIYIYKNPQNIFKLYPNYKLMSPHIYILKTPKHL